jgi:Mycotoxin biosynthesis protein UstYa
MSNEGSPLLSLQLHCLQRIRVAILKGNTQSHTEHCLNFLRHAILCHSDPTLIDGPNGEPPLVDSTTNFCRDWNVRMINDRVVGAGSNSLYDQGTLRLPRKK